MFYRTLAYGLLVALLFAPPGGSAGQEEREGEGVYVKERCITPSAHMPIIGFVPPESYERPCRVPTALDTARSYQGAAERPPGSNSGPAVEHFLSSVGLGGGYAWCAAYASHSLQQGPVRPLSEEGRAIRSAGARDYMDAKKTISPRDVAAGRVDVPKGSLVVWGVRGSWTGHIGLVLSDPWTGRCGRTIEGNTSPPEEDS